MALTTAGSVRKASTTIYREEKDLAWEMSIKCPFEKWWQWPASVPVNGKY